MADLIKDYDIISLPIFLYYEMLRWMNQIRCVKFCNTYPLIKYIKTAIFLYSGGSFFQIETGK